VGQPGDAALSRRGPGPAAAAAAFSGFVFAQAAAGVVAATLAVRTNDAQALALTGQSLERLATEAALRGTIIGFAISAVFLAALIARVAPAVRGDGSPAGLAMRMGSGRQWIVATLAGAAAAGAYALAAASMPLAPDAPTGPLARMAATPGTTRAAWAVMALVAAPIEEALFRGYMFAGLARRWGAAPAAVLVTILFVGLHTGELVYMPLAAVGITVLAVGTIAARLGWRALGPAVAMHLGYNATIVGAAYFMP
jgi:membrane protease YdiL (CAAX protease family)